MRRVGQESLRQDELIDFHIFCPVPRLAIFGPWLIKDEAPGAGVWGGAGADNAPDGGVHVGAIGVVKWPPQRLRRKLYQLSSSFASSIGPRVDRFSAAALAYGAKNGAEFGVFS